MFEKTGIPTNNTQLAGQPLSRAGFKADGTVPRSATQQLSKELETATLTAVNDEIKKIAASTITSIQTKMEVVSVQNVDQFSAAIFNARPDNLSFFTDRQFADGVAQYLGIPAPSLKNHTHRFIGKGKRAQAVDGYGIAIHNACLPGGEYIRQHSKIQSTLRDIIRTSGFPVDLKARNWLLGKLPTAVQAAYDAHNIENPRCDAIIPDLKVHQ